MKAIWQKSTDRLEVDGGQSHHGQPRIWTVSAWVKTDDGVKEQITVKSKQKTTLAGIINLINEEFVKFEDEHGATTDAGFTAIAR